MDLWPGTRRSSERFRRGKVRSLVRTGGMGRRSVQGVNIAVAAAAQPRATRPEDA